jgi:hypothetical protein
MASRSLLELVRDGTLPVGTELFHTGLRNAERAATAVVVAGGIEFRGTVYASPSGAARAVVGTKAENGWRFWRLRSGGQALADLRARP